jgi:hypothetical protein
VLTGRALALVDINLAAFAGEAGRAGAGVVRPEVGARAAVPAGGGPELVHLYFTRGPFKPRSTGTGEICSYEYRYIRLHESYFSVLHHVEEEVTYLLCTVNWLAGCNPAVQTHR